MTSPFPGMDPYLESPDLWPDVHHGLISAMQELLNRDLLPRYTCRVEERLYVAPDPYPGLTRVRIPDADAATFPGGEGTRPSAAGTWSDGEGYEWVEVDEVVEPLREPYLTIRRRGEGEVVTVIELLTPANKAVKTAAHAEYLEKRDEFLQSQAHLVEIDLLRAGKRPVRIFHAGGDFYAAYINRAPIRRRTRPLFWPLPKPLPIIPVPLQDPDPPARLDLQQALTLAYARRAYGASIDYQEPATPPLTEENADWAKALIAKAMGER